MQWLVQTSIYFFQSWACRSVGTFLLWAVCWLASGLAVGIGLGSLPHSHSPCSDTHRVFLTVRHKDPRKHFKASAHVLPLAFHRPRQVTGMCCFLCSTIQERVENWEQVCNLPHIYAVCSTDTLCLCIHFVLFKQKIPDVSPADTVSWL